VALGRRSGSNEAYGAIVFGMAGWKKEELEILAREDA